jgi:hypothetical protein
VDLNKQLDYEGFAAAEVAALQETGLSRVSELVRKQLAYEKLVEDLEEQLIVAKRDLREISEQHLPSALHEHGLKELRMDDGSYVSVSTYYNASIPKDRTPEALDWLRENEFGDLVKNTVSASFGRGNDEVAQELLNDLQLKGMDVSQKQWVEPMTLKAFVKEQVEKGSEIPTDLFGVYIGEKAKIRRK